MSLYDPGLFSPGEPVFDQETGEPYIDEDGAMVQVSPGSKVTTPDGRTLSGDNTANAAWYRSNKFERETLRDRTVGVPYQTQVLGQPSVVLAVTSVLAEVKARTPGVSGVLGVQVTTYSAATRVLRFDASLRTVDGATVPTTTTVVG